MNIDFIDIQNFRKLKNCRINISEKETIFVGANNSGKTTAMDALIGKTSQIDHLIPVQIDHQFRSKLTTLFQSKLTT